MFDPVPPYRVRRTATMDEDALRDALFDAEERLGRRLDETPRAAPRVAPTACPTSRTAFDLDLDRRPGRPRARGAARARSTPRSGSTGRDLFAARAPDRRARSRARIRVDPHARLDVVLARPAPFPLDVVDGLSGALRALAAVLSLAIAGYAGRGRAAARHDRGSARRRAAGRLDRCGAEMRRTCSGSRRRRRRPRMRAGWATERPAALVTDRPRLARRGGRRCASARMRMGRVRLTRAEERVDAGDGEVREERRGERRRADRS